MPGRRVEPVDAIVAGSLALAAQVEIWAPDLAAGMGEVTGDRPFLSLTAALMTLPLALRRSLPLLSAALVLGAAAAQELLSTPPEGLSSLVAVLLAAYSLGAHTVGTSRYAGAAIGLVGGLAMAGDDVAFLLLLLAAAWVAGLLVGNRSRNVHLLLADNQALAQQRREAAARGAAEERTRIARELHDVVSHRVSMMVVQAQAADALFDDSPERAREAMRAVDDAGRQALAELRTLLGLLRSANGSSGTPWSPQPGLADLDGLVATSRDAGVAVSLRRSGEPGPLPPAVESAAFRVVQEAITNVVKHGAGAPAVVTVEHADTGVSVSVQDAGPAPTEWDEGYGLAGMRERVEFVGGSLSVGPAPDGGFAVRAWLPASGGET